MPVHFRFFFACGFGFYWYDCFSFFTAGRAVLFSCSSRGSRLVLFYGKRRERGILSSALAPRLFSALKGGTGREEGTGETPSATLFSVVREVVFAFPFTSLRRSPQLEDLDRLEVPLGKSLYHYVTVRPEGNCFEFKYTRPCAFIRGDDLCSIYAGNSPS